MLANTHDEDNLLGKLTIVVPSYGRQGYLLRTLGFIEKYNFHHVIVVDGTPSNDLSSVISARFPRIKYIHSESGFVKRISMAIPFITTKYVALWGDDEYWMPSFISAAISFLDDNDDYALCLGLSVAFEITPEVKFSEAYPKLIKIDNLGKTKEERLLARFRNYAWGGLWGVSRSEAWINSWAVPGDKEFPVRGATEIQFEAAMAWQGGVKVLRELAWLRSLDSSSIDTSNDVSLNKRYPLFHVWWQVASNTDREEFIDSFLASIHLSPNDKAVFREAFRIYSFKARWRIFLTSTYTLPCALAKRVLRILGAGEVWPKKRSKPIRQILQIPKIDALSHLVGGSLSTHAHREMITIMESLETNREDPQNPAGPK